MKENLYIGVLGGANPHEKFLDIAYEVGALLAKNKITVLCGGLSGVMKEVSRGVHDNNGVVIGILPGYSRIEENEYLTYSITTGIGYARNFLIVRAAESLIAIDGSNGTISEESFAISEGKDVIGIESLVLKKSREREGNYYSAESAEEAVNLAIASAEKQREKHIRDPHFFDS
ncbi:MAG: TIGR00725 family protein [Cuniculiplasma sp.]